MWCTCLVWVETWSHNGDAWAPAPGSEWLLLSHICSWFWFPWWLSGKNPPASAGDARHMGSIPGLERSPRGANGSSLQYSCLFPWTEQPGRLWSMGMQRVIMNDWAHTNSWFWLVFGNWFHYCGSHCRAGEVNPSFIPHRQSATLHSCDWHHCCLWERVAKTPAWFLSTETFSCLQAYLDKVLLLTSWTTFIWDFCCHWFCWVMVMLGAWSPAAVHLGEFSLCVWTMVPSFNPQHLQKHHPPSV